MALIRWADETHLAQVKMASATRSCRASHNVPGNGKNNGTGNGQDVPGPGTSYSMLCDFRAHFTRSIFRAIDCCWNSSL